MIVMPCFLKSAPLFNDHVSVLVVYFPFFKAFWQDPLGSWRLKLIAWESHLHWVLWDYSGDVYNGFSFHWTVWHHLSLSLRHPYVLSILTNLLPVPIAYPLLRRPPLLLVPTPSLLRHSHLPHSIWSSHLLPTFSFTPTFEPFLCCLSMGLSLSSTCNKLNDFCHQQ